MNAEQRKIVWVGLAVLAVPVGILAGIEYSESFWGPGGRELEGIYMFICVVAAFVAAALFLRAGGKKDEE